MPIGDGNSNRSNGNNTLFEPTFYSRLRFRNGDQNVSITFRSGLLVIEIGTVSATEGYKVVPTGTIHLSPIKCNMLAAQLDSFLEYRANEKKIDDKKAFGVNAGMNSKVSYIGFSTNNDKDIIMTIGKFDENGVITESTQFKFSSDYNYALDWADITSNDLSKVYMNDVEINMFKNLVIDFGRSMSGAYGYASADINRYEVNRTTRKIETIMDKLGIDRPRYNGNSGGSRTENNYLSNASSRSTSFEDVEDLLG